MAEWETLGVRGIFDGTAFFPGVKQFNTELEKANKVVEKFTANIGGRTTQVTKTVNKNFQGMNKEVHKFAVETADGVKQVTATFKTMVTDVAASQKAFFAPIQASNAALKEGTQTVATWSAEVEGGVLTVQKTFSAGMPKATKTVETFKKNVDGSMQTVRRSLTDTADSADKNSKRFIRSIALIYAIFRQGPQIAAEFGEALKNAAAGKAVRDSFYRLADAAEVNAERLVSSMHMAAKGTITEIELMRVANRAFLAGGEEFAEALPELFQIARAAAVATNKDLQFVFDTLITGIARASPKLIDNAEIYLKIGDAVDEYAESVGKSVDEISAQEKIHATLVAVLEDGRKVVKDIGADTEMATDQYYRARVAVDNFKQSVLELADKLTSPLGPALYGIGEILNDIAPVLQTIALLKMAGAGSLLGALAGVPLLKGLAKGAGVVTTALIGAKLGAEGFDAAVEKLNLDLPKSKEVFGDLSDMLGYGIKQLTEGKEAADEWLRAQVGIMTLAEAAMQAEAAQEALLETVLRGPDAYEKYREAVAEYNSELERGMKAIPMMTQAQFDLDAVMQKRGSIDYQIAALERLRENIKEQPFNYDIFSKAILDAKLAELEEAKALEIQNAALERQKKLREALAEPLQSLRDKIKDLAAELSKSTLTIEELEQELTTDLEAEVRDRSDRIRKLELQAIWDREDAYIKFNRAIRDAERQRVRAIEDINRQHRYRLEDIEWDHQRRLLEIQEEYRRTVQEAAIERDALAIIRARERRAQEITEAERDRQDQIRSENRSYAERLLQAQRSFEDRVEKARQALADELADIARNLQRKLELERQADAQRLADQKKANDEEIAEEKRKHDALIQELENYVNRRNRIMAMMRPAPTITRGRSRVPVEIPGLGLGMQGGFDGMVTGPQTFHVEPGVREYVYASGDLRGGRQPVTPSAAAAQVQQLRTAVAGSVNVGLQGFSQDLLGRIGPGVSEMVGQSLVDMLAEAFERAL